MAKNARDKHSKSLFCRSVSEEENHFITLAPGGDPSEVAGPSAWCCHSGLKPTDWSTKQAKERKVTKSALAKLLVDIIWPRVRYY